MKIFLTGSTSYLGTKFIELYGDAFTILGVARSDKNHPVDLTDFAAVEALFTEFEPDVILHTAADLGRDASTSDSILKTGPSITTNLIRLAQKRSTPFIFTSTEAVYGGKIDGDYHEDDSYQPRSDYGASKVLSEELIIASDLPYLITRAHRYIGISKTFNRTKQFPDTLNALSQSKPVSLDSKKLFTPLFINHLCDVLAYHMSNKLSDKTILNVGIDKPTTYGALVLNIAKKLGFDDSLITGDGDEAGWPANSTLNFERLKNSDYPQMEYAVFLDTLASEYRL